MELNGIANLIFLIKQNNIKNILEIGTAISYSAHMMASIDTVKHIDTIERDLETASIAEKFICRNKKLLLTRKILLKTSKYFYKL